MPDIISERERRLKLWHEPEGRMAWFPADQFSAIGGNDAPVPVLFGIDFMLPRKSGDSSRTIWTMVP